MTVTGRGDGPRPAVPSRTEKHENPADHADPADHETHTDHTDHLDLPGRRGSRVRRWWAVPAVLLLTGAAAGTVVALRGGGDPAPGEQPPEQPTATVRREDLVAGETVNGTLGYAPGPRLPNRLAGTVTRLPETGAVIEPGEELYRLDDRPVLLFEGRIPVYRPFSPGMSDGKDVRQLEETLARLGYTGFTVDERYTAGTVSAVRRWQRSLGLPVTGRIELGRVLFAPGPVRVGKAEAGLGDEAAAGSPVLATTRTERSVTAEVTLGQQRLFAPKTEATVALPGDGTLRGTVSSVGTVVAGGEDGEGEPEDETVTVRIALEEKPGGADDDGGGRGGIGGVTRAPVRVTVESERREDVLSVPVAALLALREGGYGVELVEDGASRVVPVETGLFADGRVEVTGGGLAEGDKVGTPRL